MTDQHDLDWLAFRYLQDELTPAEVEAFEAVLAQDQRAREALAASVELRSAILAAGAHRTELLTPVSAPSISASLSWARRLAWMSLGAAAALAVVVAWQSLLPNGEVAKQTDGATRSSEREALLWAESRAEGLDQDSESPRSEWEDGEPAGPARESGAAADADLSDQATATIPLGEGDLHDVEETPSWLVAGVSGAKEEGGVPVDEPPPADREKDADSEGESTRE